MARDDIQIGYEIGFDDDEDMGARRKVRQRLPPGVTIAPVAARKNWIASSIPGTQPAGDQSRRQPGGFPVVSFVAGGQTTITVTAKVPNPTRIVTSAMEVARTGATATGLVSVVALEVNNQKQVLCGVLPAGMFAPNSTVFLQGGLDLDIASASSDISLTLSISVLPTGTDRVDCALGFLADVLKVS